MPERPHTVENEPELESGTMVGEYRVERKVGEGGMASVYAALHPVIGKKAAIKIMARRLSADAVSINRFVQEARAVNQIGHANIVDIFAFGQLPDGRHYFVMEWLGGEVLAQRLSRGRLPPSEVIEVLLQVCDALEAVHDQGMVHRDLKPENLFLLKKAQKIHVKLLDFGIAKLSRAGGDDLRNTRSGSWVGTPCYMSPEQARGKEIDQRTDIYSLGVMAYELFLGRPPFDAETAADVVSMHLHVPPPPPRKRWPNIPPMLERALLGMLDKDARARPTLPHVRRMLIELRDSATLIDADDTLPPSSLVPRRTKRPATGIQVRTTPSREGRTSSSDLPLRVIETTRQRTPPPVQSVPRAVVAAPRQPTPPSSPSPAPAPQSQSRPSESSPPAAAAEPATPTSSSPIWPLRVAAVLLVATVATVIALALFRPKAPIAPLQASATVPATRPPLVAPPPLNPAPPTPSLPPVSAIPPPVASAPGTLVVHVNVPGARVELDGRVVADPVQDARIPIEHPGDHLLVVSAPHRQPQRRILSVAAGVVVEERFILERDRSALSSATAPGVKPYKKSGDRDYTIDPFDR